MSKITELIPEPWGYFLGVISFVLPALVMGVNSFKMRTIEKILLTNIGKLSVFISHTVLFSLLLELIILFMSFNNGVFSKIELDGSNEILVINDYFFKYFIISSITSFFLVFSIILTIHIALYLLSVKTLFYIKETKDSEELNFIRKVDKSTFLFEGENNKSVFYEKEQLLKVDLYERLKIQPKNHGVMHWIESHAHILLVPFILFFIVGLLLELIFNWTVISLLFVGVGSIFLLITFIANKNYEIKMKLEIKNTVETRLSTTKIL